MIVSNTPLADFITLLTEEGRALTRGDLHRQPPSKADLVLTEQVLHKTSELAKSEAPAGVPTFDVSSAMWSAQAFAWACGMLIDRSETDVELPQRLLTTAPAGGTVSEHWSVDLVLRYAKDLIDRSAKIGPADPLHDQLIKLVEPWPLSAVGTDSQNPDAKLGVMASNECLRTIYVDRVIQFSDQQRASHEAVKPWIQQSIGGHRSLAGHLVIDDDQPQEEAT